MKNGILKYNSIIFISSKYQRPTPFYALGFGFLQGSQTQTHEKWGWKYQFGQRKKVSRALSRWFETEFYSSEKTISHSYKIVSSCSIMSRTHFATWYKLNELLMLYGVCESVLSLIPFMSIPYTCRSGWHWRWSCISLSQHKMSTEWMNLFWSFRESIMHWPNAMSELAKAVIQCCALRFISSQLINETPYTRSALHF